MLALILGAVFLIAGVYHAFRGTPRIWRDPEQARRITENLTGFPFGPEVRRGLVRGTVLMTTNMFLLGGGLICGALWQQQTTANDANLLWAFMASVGLTLTSVLLGLLITWFNVPKALVPPHMRDEVGLVTRKLRDARHRRSHRS
ncbi:MULTISPECIES: hypothetical protein [unclassified Streptomyces]|uniref:hypothetical protein n=1 Tax=unclassified Streptomyces TaxID=2593676 RepID=UPI0011CD7778|nr:MULTISPECIES: hypothetical protein [unclassified Streptomyces]TXS68698.1 hypothetical protein EAO69_27705 [Streptomyces sp. me109]